MSRVVVVIEPPSKCSAVFDLARSFLLPVNKPLDEMKHGLVHQQC